MRVVFDLALDQAGWLGPPAPAWGMGWLGPHRLVERLELGAGLARPPALDLEREAAAVPTVDALWPGAGASDPFARARHCLEQADLMVLYAVPEVPETAPFLELARRCPGLPGRLHDLLRAPPVGVDEVRLCELPETMPPLWQRLWAHLRRHGVRVAAPPEARPDAALGGLQAPHAHEMVAESAWAVADSLAAHLARHSRRQTLLVGGDQVLDAALARHGLPRVAPAPAAAPHRLLLHAALELALDPIDPEQAVAFLTASPAQLHPQVARRLLAALADRAAVGADPWQKAMHRATPAQAAEVDGWFRPQLRRTRPVDLGVLDGRLAGVQALLDARAARERGRVARGTAEAGEGLVVVRRALARSGRTCLPLDVLRRLVASVGEAMRAPPVAEAGLDLAAIGRPEGVLAGVDHLVWYNATESGGARPRLPLLGARARRQLREHHGWSPPSAAEEAGHLARRAARPLAWARHSLLLARAEHDAAGRALAPHPALARLRAAGRLHLWVAPPAARARPATPPRPFVAAAEVTTAHGLGLARRARWQSPSRLEIFLGCPLRWALKHGGHKLEDEALPDLALSPRTAGLVAHMVLELALKRGLGAEGAALRALFDEVVPRVAARYDLPEHRIQRAQLGRAVEAGIGALIALAKRHRWRLKPEEVEVALCQDFRFVSVGGRADVVLAEPRAIIDLKTGSEAPLVEVLATGASLQLAAYSRLVLAADGAPPGTPMPAAGYFVLGSARLITAGPLPGGEQLGPPLARTWRGFARAFRRVEGDLRRGRLRAPGNDPSVPTSTLDQGVLQLAPPCRYCTSAFVCGKRSGR